MPKPDGSRVEGHGARGLGSRQFVLFKKTAFFNSRWQATDGRGLPREDCASLDYCSCPSTSKNNNWDAHSIGAFFKEPVSKIEGAMPFTLAFPKAVFLAHTLNIRTP